MGETEEKREKELRSDQRCYIHIHVYVMSLSPFTATGHIIFIFLNQAAGWSKFDCGPDLARGQTLVMPAVHV